MSKGKDTKKSSDKTEASSTPKEKKAAKALKKQAKTSNGRLEL